MPENASNRSLSVEKWHQLSQQGVDIPVRIPVNGWSMQPLIRRNRDLVTIRPLRLLPKTGDIVLFSDPARDRYVLHRVWETDGKRILTWGDNCVSPDGWMPSDQIWGIVAQVERGGRTIRFDTGNAAKNGMRLAKITHRACRVRRSVLSFAGRLPAPVKRVIKRLLGRKTAE